MTAKEFYKKTSDMAYPVKFSQTIDDEDIVVGKIGFTGKTRDDAEKFLKENNFFAIDCNTDNIDLDEVSLVLEFHYDVDRFDAFMLTVCDTIDCREAGGKLVLSCTDEHELIKEVFPEEKKSEDVPQKCECKECKPMSIFDAFDELIKFPSFNEFPKFPEFPSFPKFPDFDKMMENTKKTIEDIRNNASKDKDGNTKFYDFSCKIGPDGKVSIKRTTNDGTIEKTFTLGDNNSSKKIEVKDDGASKASDSVKRLKDVL